MRVIAIKYKKRGGSGPFEKNTSLGRNFKRHRREYGLERIGLGGEKKNALRSPKKGGTKQLNINKSEEQEKDIRSWGKKTRILHSRRGRRF